MIRIAYIKTFFDHMVSPYSLPEDVEVKKGEWYVVSTKFGNDVGLAMTNSEEKSREELFPNEKDQKSGKHPSRKKGKDHADEDETPGENESLVESLPQQLESNRVLGLATRYQVEERRRYAEEEEEAYFEAKKEVDELGLEMKLINVHYLLGKKKVIFNFTADNRVDFRQLVKRLASMFKTRIEMRQIGVRDAAKIQGGVGVCGQVCCCNRSNCHMDSIYLKMAKEQGFVVNSSKLTGLCGRLMCCLAYENDFYAKERKKYPPVGSFVMDGKKRYKIFSFNVLKNEIFSSDEHHHPKKFSHEAIEFIKKDSSGVNHYRLKDSKQQ